MSVLINASGSLLRCSRLCGLAPQLLNQSFLHVDSADLAARKGTRERKLKLKLKNRAKAVIEPKKKWSPTQGKKITDWDRRDRHATDDDKPVAIDDTYLMKLYRERTLPFAEAIKCFEENNHPTVYDVPESHVIAKIEFNMQGEKKTRMKDNFQRLALLPNAFEIDKERTILVFCKEKETANQCIEKGATKAGGNELIRSVQTGDIKPLDFQYILAEPDMLTELLPIRGLLKKKFPAPALNTLGEDIVALVEQFLTGLVYEGKRNDIQPNFGLVTTAIGFLDQGTEQLEANLAAVLKDADSLRPKRDGLFITRCYLSCESTEEQFKVDPFLYIDKERKVVKKKTVSAEDSIVADDDSDSDDEAQKKEKAN